MANGFRLVMSEGPQPGQTFVLDRDLLAIGRDPTNHIVINDPQVSRQHARIARQGDLMVIEDVGSTNSTFVNGMRLTSPHTLVNGDVIGLGDAVTLTFYGGSAIMTEPLPGRATVSMQQQYYEPPPPPPPQPVYTAAPSPDVQPVAQPTEAKKSRTGLWVGCGCLVLLVVIACAAVFVLDYLRILPPIFYEPLRWLGLI
jgi:hypothetical protein